ncbi:MAG: hypothetical protein J7K23_08845 [Thermoproteales archaeon]|nr:hypothetical protein [Thermoproteales archaeon]
MKPNHEIENLGLPEVKNMIITRKYLISLKKSALRQGTWFKIDKIKRVALEIAIKTLKIIRSEALLQLVKELIYLIDKNKALLLQAWEMGIRIIKLRIKQAEKIGYRKARSWLKDKQLIIQLGIAYLNIPPAYRPTI